jgi:hypothetical protein
VINKTKLGRGIDLFYPYESVHVTDAFLVIEDKNMEWYLFLTELLNRHKAGGYSLNYTANDFRPEMDNKITIRFSGPDVDDKGYSRRRFLTYWDNTVYIGDKVHPIRSTTDVKYCDLIKK